MTTFSEFPFVSGEFFVLRERLENLYFPAIRHLYISHNTPILHNLCFKFSWVLQFTAVPRKIEDNKPCSKRAGNWFDLGQ